MNEIELEKLGADHPLNRAMRRVARYWPVVYSKLLCLQWEWTDDSGHHPVGGHIAYGATDGVLLILNPKGVEDMSKESKDKVGDAVGYVAFLLVHEGEHAILNHGVRLDKFADREEANRAADYKVNEMAVHRNQEVRQEHGLSHDVFPLPEWVLLDMAMSEPHTTEQLYQHLKKNEQRIQPKQVQDPPVPDSGDNKSEGGSDSGDPAGTPEGEGGDSGVGVDHNPDPDVGGAGPLGPTSPEPGALNPESGDGGQGDGPPTSDPGSGRGVPTPSPDADQRPGAGGVDTFPPVAPEGTDQGEFEDDLEEQNEVLMVNDALDSHACGSESASNKRLAEERKACSPQDWVAYAEQFVEVRCEDGWMAPYNHGVFIATGLCAPGREGKKVGDIIVVADSSGSISSEAWKRFFELNQHILDEIEPERVLLVSCAEKVKDYTVLERGDTVPTSMGGGGGTSFREAFDWVEADPDKLCIDPLLLIYFTDGQCDDHKEMMEPEYPVLWLSYQKDQEHFPWGEFAKITVA